MKTFEHLVGQLGEFTDHDGSVRQCRVTGVAGEGFEELNGMIEIKYCLDGKMIPRAFIHGSEFRPNQQNK